MNATIEEQLPADTAVLAIPALIAAINTCCYVAAVPVPLPILFQLLARVVLGIINKDGCIADYITLPVSNLHEVPAGLSNEEACFAEPLAAACRLLEQGLLQDDDGGSNQQRTAVVGELLAASPIGLPS